MVLAPDVLKRLGDTLQECLARITQTDGSLPAGAGFFVSDTLLVTNRHVVGPHAGIEPQLVRVHPFGGEPVSGRVLPQPESAPQLDIALVEIEPASERQAVVLHRKLDSGDYLLAGYPKENFYTELAPGSELSPPGVLKGTPHLNNQTTKPELLRLSGYQIRPGHSGGPVLNATTGAVVAVTVYSENPDDDLGGAALPIELALEAYPQLAQLAVEPPLTAVARYRDILGRACWEALDLVWQPDRQVDIYLAGERSCWQIGLHKDDAGNRLTASDLGNDVTEVLVQWARSSGSRDESEVLLLGRLLSAALFPRPVADRLPLPADVTGDPVLIRLHVDPSGPLADLPWELAIDPNDGERKRFLAATDGYSFVRVNPGAPARDDDAAQPSALTEHLNVLRIVVQPQEHTLWPQVVVGTKPVSWPATATIDADLASRIAEPKGLQGNPLFVSGDPLVNPTLSDLESRVAHGAVDVVHYVGFGYQEPEGGPRTGLDRCWLALSSGEGYDDLLYHRARDVVQQIAGLRPRLVVMQFATPSPSEAYLQLGGQRCQPIGPMLLEAADTLGADAMICTRPMHPIQYDRFNRRLYLSLAEGLTVEQAVQRARRAVFLDKPVDYAGFGWFVLTTGNRLRRRYFERPGSSDAAGAMSTPAGNR